MGEVCNTGTRGNESRPGDRTGPSTLSLTRRNLRSSEVSWLLPECRVPVIHSFIRTDMVQGCAKQNAGDSTHTVRLPAKSTCSGWEGRPEELGTTERPCEAWRVAHRTCTEVCPLRSEGRGTEVAALWVMGIGACEQRHLTGREELAQPRRATL